MKKNKFEKISIIDPMDISENLKEKLIPYSNQEITVFNSAAKNDDEIIERIDDSDCVLISWNGNLNANVLVSCLKLRYVGLCSTLFKGKSSNVDLDVAEELGITVNGIKDYGDIGTVEFTISEIIAALKGSNGHSMNKVNRELKNCNIGILGMGNLGYKIARTLVFFGAKVFYHSRTRKSEIENEHIKFLELNDLLKTVDILSFNLPRNTKVMCEADFEVFGNGKIIINTSLGCPFDINGFSNWISNEENYAIFDADGLGEFKEKFENQHNIRIAEFFSGYTAEAMERQIEKVVENIEDYLLNK